MDLGRSTKNSILTEKSSTDQEPHTGTLCPSLKTTVSADASSFGLGAVLLQEQTNGETRAVAYISHAMTPTEQRYAQIEKESLAITWACEHFEDYLLGLRFQIETDHKPLVLLLGKKLLDKLSATIPYEDDEIQFFN